MSSVPEPAQETKHTALFQARQRLDEDDLRALYELERKKYRSKRGLLIYIRACAFVTALVLVFASGALICWTLYAFLSAAFVWSPLLLLAWTLFIPNSILILIQYAFPKKIEKKSLKQVPENLFSFYEDHFSVSSDTGAEQAQYTCVTKYVEKDGRFFIFVATNMAYVLRKTSFVVGTPEEFSRFMREKYRTKDMKPSEKGL